MKSLPSKKGMGVVDVTKEKNILSVCEHVLSKFDSSMIVSLSLSFFFFPWHVFSFLHLLASYFACGGSNGGWQQKRQASRLYGVASSFSQQRNR